MTARTTLTDAWPIFGLRLRTERLVLRLPTDEELAPLMVLARKGHPSARRDAVRRRLVDAPEPGVRARLHAAPLGRCAARGRPTDWFLNLMTELDGVPIGSQSIGAKDFAIHRTVGTPGRGSAWSSRAAGSARRCARRSSASPSTGSARGSRRPSAFLDNAASNAVSRGLGYEENGFGSLAPQGVARTTQQFRMTDECWRSRPRPPLTIEGLDACREMFGA